MNQVDPRDPLTDDQLEALFSGDASVDPELFGFIESARSLRGTVSDNGFVGIRLAAAVRESRQRRKSRFRQLATLTTAFALLVAFSATAVAANNSAPGDWLYPIDRSLERIGIMDGGFQERIDEYDALVDSGETEKAREILEDLAEQTNEATQPGSEEIANGNQGTTSPLHEFIEANKGKDVGVDGREFGQSVSEIARANNEKQGNGQANSAPPGQENKSETGASEKAPGPPPHAGPKDDNKPQGKPEHAGPKNK